MVESAGGKAVDFDKLLDSIFDDEKTFLVNVTQIPGVEPSIRFERFFRGPFISKVAFHDVGAFEQDLNRLKSVSATLDNFFRAIIVSLPLRSRWFQVLCQLENPLLSVACLP